MEIRETKELGDFTYLPISWEEKGIEKGKEEVALELIKEGASTHLIAKVTHLDQDEIERLKKKLNE